MGDATDRRKVCAGLALVLGGFVVGVVGFLYLGTVVGTAAAWPTAVAGFVTLVGVMGAAVATAVEIVWTD